jgi:ketosteroid isomerase-like protein
MSQGNVEVIRRAFDAFNGGDRLAFLQLYDDDIVLRIGDFTIESGSYYGATEVEHQYARLFAPFGESYRVEISELIAVGDSVVVVHCARARGQRSGAEVGAPGAAIFTLRGGKIIRIDQLADRSEALAALGVSEQDAHADS